MAPERRRDELQERQDSSRTLGGPCRFAVEQQIEQTKSQRISLDVEPASILACVMLEPIGAACYLFSKSWMPVTRRCAYVTISPKR